MKALLTDQAWHLSSHLVGFSKFLLFLLLIGSAQAFSQTAEQWRQHFSAGSLTLVFSSYYPNNPASVFGHTLIRVNRKSNSSPLLSQGVNYAAISDTRNPIKYVLWGLFGGFHGEFAVLPYFYKVREYSDFESRDLWEYDLNLTQEQVDRFIDYLWETRSTQFDYYYLSENCSYQLLKALEAAVPNLKLTEKLPWWVIPADTIKAVVETPGLVKKIEFRPSQYRQSLARYEKIKNNKDLRQAYNKINSSYDVEALKKLTLSEQALVLDMALPEKPEWLAYRAKLPPAEEVKIEITQEDHPENSHGSFRYGVGGGHESIDGNFAELDLRFALHDLLDDSSGLPKNAKIEVLRLKARTYEQFKKSTVESFRLVDFQSLAPVNEIRTPLSWHFSFGIDRTRQIFCDYCSSSDMLAQVGYSYSFLRDKTLLYGLAGVHSYWPDGMGFLGSPQLNTGLRLKWSRRFSSLIDYEWQHVLGPKYEAYEKINFETRYLINKDLQVSADFVKGTHHDFQSLFKIFIFR